MEINPFSKLVTAVIATLLPMSGWCAVEVPDSVTGTEQRVDEVTVVGRRSPIKVSADVPVQTIGGKEISELGIQNMADAVRRFAGANVRDYGRIGG